ncbi:MAG: glycosyltransferase [Microbacterium sp.]
MGFGGYASAPAYVAARREGIPYVVHEANGAPRARERAGCAAGCTGRRDLQARRCGAARSWECRSGARIVELDRAALRDEAAATFGLDASRPVLLSVFGGSSARGG